MFRCDGKRPSETGDLQGYKYASFFKTSQKDASSHGTGSTVSCGSLPILGPSAPCQFAMFLYLEAGSAGLRGTAVRLTKERRKNPLARKQDTSGARTAACYPVHDAMTKSLHMKSQFEKLNACMKQDLSYFSH